MDELRHDVNEAFDKRQHELGDLKGVPERMLLTARAARGQRADNRLRLVAGLAAILVVALVIGTFAFVRAGILGPRVPAGSPKPGVSPTPTALKTLLNVPDSTPVILYTDPVNDQRDGITWDGKLSGRVDWPVSGLPNPQANLFATGTEIMDRSGRPVATGTFLWSSFAWADDGFHFCQTVPSDPSRPQTLQLVTPGSAPRNVIRLGAGVGVAACSTLKDRAVVEVPFGTASGMEQYWVVQLSTGKVLWTHRFNPAYPVSKAEASRPSIAVVVASDGQYIAENTGGCCSNGVNLKQTPAASTIFGPDGSRVAQLPEWVEALSWDGSLVVTDGGEGSRPLPLRLIRWRTGEVVWSGPSGFALLAVVAERGGTSLLIGIYPVADFAPGKRTPIIPADFYVVSFGGGIDAHWTYRLTPNYHPPSVSVG